MTRAGAAALGLALVTAGSAEAQSEPRYTVTWQPLALLLTAWQLEFEAAPTRGLTLHATPSVVFTVDDGVPRPLAFAMDLGVRVFPFGRAPAGFFLGAHAGAATWDIVSLLPATDGFGLRGGTTVGYTFVLARRWALSLGGGVEYVRFTPSGQGAPTVEFVLPFVRAAAGVAF